MERRTRTARSLALAAALLLVACATERAPETSTSLPDELRARFRHGLADRLYLTRAEEPVDVWVDLAYTNAGGAREVRLRYHHLDPQELYTSNREVRAVAYQPTAVCARAGRSDTFYVAGWHERGAVSVIERWRIASEATVEIATAPDGYEVTTIAFPSIERTVVHREAGSEPIRDMACHPFADELWLLRGSAPRQLMALDLATGETSLRASSDQPGLEALADHAAIWAQMNARYGFTLQTERAPKWVPLTKVDEPYEVIVWSDADLDGTCETVETLAYGAFHARYVTAGWDHRFEAPD